MLLEAQRREWNIYYGTLDDIWLRDGEAVGRLTNIQVADDPNDWFELRAIPFDYDFNGFIVLDE